MADDEFFSGDGGKDRRKPECRGSKHSSGSANLQQEMSAN